MNTDETPVDIPARHERAPKSLPDRYFYSGAAALLLVLTFTGFRYFYLHGQNSSGRELDPAYRGLLITHGIVMTAWVLIFMVQPLWIVSGNRVGHRLVGWVGTVVALGVVVVGIRLIIPVPPNSETDTLFYGLTPRQFNGFILSTILTFAGFVFIGVWNRKRPAIHRPMMLLATLAVMPAVFDRIPWIMNLYYDNILGLTFGPYFAPLVLGVLLLGLKGLLTRSWDRSFALGCAAFGGVSLFVMTFVKTRAWDTIGEFLSR